MEKGAALYIIYSSSSAKMAGFVPPGRTQLCPILLFALFRGRRSGTLNLTKFRQIPNESIKPKHKQNAMFFTRSKNNKKVQ